ncbi:MAG: dUTP diphosphatase [Pseudomonadota bacterium]
MYLKIKRVCNEARELTYATQGSAGLDLSYPYKEKITILPGEKKLISSGIAIEIPDNCEAQIRSRSGFASKFGIIVLNAPATIDSDYRGEIKILLFNCSKESFILEQHMRIAQLVIAPILRPKIEYVDKLSSTSRGEKGFGSSGSFYKLDKEIV